MAKQCRPEKSMTRAGVHALYSAHCFAVRMLGCQQLYLDVDSMPDDELEATAALLERELAQLRSTGPAGSVDEAELLGQLQHATTRYIQVTLRHGQPLDGDVVYRGLVTAFQAWYIAHAVRGMQHAAAPLPLTKAIATASDATGLLFAAIAPEQLAGWLLELLRYRASDSDRTDPIES